MNIGVLLAGGSGRRMGASVPKQFLPLAGRPLMEHAIRTFDASPEIDEIFIVSNAEFLDETANIARSSDFHKVSQILTGGSERSDSSLAAIRATEGLADCRLLFHDIVRPLVSEELIRRVCLALDEHAAVSVAIASTDTIFRVSGDRVASVPPRSELRRVQTPQGFRREVIAEAYRRALADPAFQATDDCGVVLRYMPEVPVVVVEGDERNLKITHPDDIPLAEFWMSR